MFILCIGLCKMAAKHEFKISKNVKIPWSVKNYTGKNYHFYSNNKCTVIESVDNNNLLNRLHTAMITVLVMGSTLLFGVSRWKHAGPLLIRITVFIITSVWFRFTSFVMYDMKSYSVHEWITLKTISLFLKTVQNRGHIIWQGWMVSHYDKIGLQNIYRQALK